MRKKKNIKKFFPKPKVGGQNTLSDKRPQLVFNTGQDKTSVSPDYQNIKEESKGLPLRQFLGDIITNTQSTLDYSFPTPLSEYPKQTVKKLLGYKLQPIGKSAKETRLEDLLTTPTLDEDEDKYQGGRGEDFLYRKGFDLAPRYFTGNIYKPVEGQENTWEFNKEDMTGKVYADEIQKLHDEFVKTGNLRRHSVLHNFNFEPSKKEYDPEKKKFYVESKYTDKYDVALNSGEEISNDLKTDPEGERKLPKLTNLLRWGVDKIMNPQTVTGTVRTYLDDEEIDNKKQGEAQGMSGTDKPRKKKNILKYFPKKDNKPFGKATPINGKDIEKKTEKQNIGGVEFDITPDAFTGLRPTPPIPIKPNLSSLYEPLQTTIPSETTKKTYLPEVVNKIEEPQGISPISGLLGTILTTEPRYMGLTPQMQEFSQRTIIPSLQQLYEGAKLKGEEQNFTNMLTPINPFRRSDQQLLQGLAGITALPFTTGQEFLRDVPVVGEPIATSLDNIFENISRVGQVPTKTGFALAKELGIKPDPEIEQGLNELAGTIAQFVLPGKLGIHKVKGIFKEMKEKMKKVSPTEQKLIIEQTKEDLQRQRIEKLKEIGEKKKTEIKPVEIKPEEVKPINQAGKKQFQEQAIPKLDEWVKDAKTYDEFRNKIQRELIKNSEPIGRKLVDYGYVKDYATVDNVYKPFEQYYNEKKQLQTIKETKTPIDEYVESLPEPTPEQIARAKKFVEIKREINLNLNSVDTPYKLHPGEIRKGLNNIRDGIDSKEARLIIDKINKAHEQGISNNMDLRQGIDKNFISGEELGKLTEVKPELKGKEQQTLVEAPETKPVNIEQKYVQGKIKEGDKKPALQRADEIRRQKAEDKKLARDEEVIDLTARKVQLEREIKFKSTPQAKLELETVNKRLGKIREDEGMFETQNKLFTEQRHNEVINKLKERRKDRLSAGLDPEELALMTEYVGYYVEKGIRTIPDITKQLRTDLGDTADYFLKNVDLKTLANLTPYNTHKDWLKGQEDVTLKERKNIGVTGKGDIVGAYTQKTGKGYTVTSAPYTPESSFAKEIGRIIANKIPERLKDYQSEYTALGFPHGLMKDRFAESVKKLLANPELRESAPELTKVLDKFDVPFTNVNPKAGTLPEMPKGKTERIKASTNVEVTPETGTYKSLKNLTSDTELNTMLDEIGQKTVKSRGGRISWEETEKNAMEIGLTVKDVKNIRQGDMVNSSMQEGIKQLAVDNARTVADIVKESTNKKLTVQQADRLKDALLTHNLLTAKMLNNVSEAGRILNIMKKGVEPREFDTLQKATDILRKSGVDIADPIKLNKKVAKIMKPSFWDKTVFWWYNSMLSNPLTDVANITGNMGYLSSEVITRSIWLPSIETNIRGFTKGLKDAKTEIAGILKAEREGISKYDFDTHTLKELYDPNPRNVHNKLLRKLGFTVHAILPTTRLRIEDALFRNIAKNMEREVGIKQLAKTEKQSRNIIEQNLKLLEESIDNKDLAKLTEQEQRYYQVIQDYEKYARELTFIEPLGKTGQTFQKLSNSNAFLKWTFPFIRIAVNLTKEGMKHTPLYIGKKLVTGQWSDLSSRQKVHLIRRGLVGSALISGLLLAMNSGKVEITGEGPRTRTKRELWLKSGYKPNHIYIGNTGIPYININPFNIVLSVIGNISDYAKYDTKFNSEDNGVINKGSLILGKVANTFLSNSFMQGAENLIRAFQDGDPNLISKIITSPLPNVGGIIRGFKGEYPIYKKATFWDYLNFKLGTGDLESKTDLYGQPKESPYRRFFFQMSDKRANEIAGYLLENNINVGMPTRPNFNGVEATDEQFEKYLKKSGQTLQANLSKYFTKIKTFDKDFQDEMIKRVAEISRAEAKKEIENPKYRNQADRLVKDELKWRGDFYKVNKILKKYDLNYSFSDEEKTKGKFDRSRFKRLYIGGNYTTSKGNISRTNGRMNDIKQGKGNYKDMAVDQRRIELQNLTKAYKEIMQ